MNLAELEAAIDAAHATGQCLQTAHQSATATQSMIMVEIMFRAHQLENDLRRLHSALVEDTKGAA